MDMKQIGATLRMLRDQKGVSVVTAAKGLDVSVSSLSCYEHGTRIPRDKVKIRIAEYYGQPLTSIFYAENVHS